MLKLESLSKQFDSVTAVDNVSLSIPEGEVFGLLGANGAGKTTTLRMLATMLSPTGGTATVCGHDIIKEPAEVRARLGIMFGGETGLYERLTARENMLYFARLGDVPEDEARRRIDSLAETFSFTEHLDKWASKLSKGTRQKVAFARAILHNPAVMLFDEPTLGLDVTSKREAEEFILRCRDEGKSIIVSDHTMATVEKLCSRVGILKNGRMLDIGPIEDLTTRNGCASLEEVFFKLAGQPFEVNEAKPAKRKGLFGRGNR